MPSPLISVAELAACLQDPGDDVLVFDCRHDLTQPEAGWQAFLDGHIPGARHLHLDRDLSGPPGPRLSPGGLRSSGGRHPLPERDTLRARLAALGVGDERLIVAVDAQGGMFAARLWWLARWLGHERVLVLDGGLPAWTAAGHALESGAARERSPGHLTPRPALTREVDIDTVLANVASRQLQLIDARSPDRYRGENETLDPVGGHIPGALNRFFKSNLDAQGLFFKPAAQLRAEWQALVAHPARAVMQCGSGVTACHHLLALAHAGLPGAALYPGSWSEWVSEGGRPIERGASAAGSAG